MQNIKDEVRRILTDTPYTRDNDKLLTSVYWMFEMGRLDKNVKKITFMEFSELYFTSKLTDAQTITRLRRQLQMKHPELRGAKYKARMANQEKVKEDLGYNV
jgi:hypothetical protein